MKRALAVATVLGCQAGQTSDPYPDAEIPPPSGTPPALSEPCALDPDDATALLITTTDFSTGAVSIADLASRTIELDVALGSTDAIPFGHEGLAYVVNRFQHDFLDVLEPGAMWRSLGQHAVTATDTVAPNPRSLAFGPDGLAYLPTHNAPTVQILDLTLPPGRSQVGAIDIATFADDDGNPEASHAVACGQFLFVTIERLDPGFARVDYDAVVAVDLETATALDFVLPTQGAWIRQLRRDPSDPAGHTLLALTTGIERLDLVAGTVEWSVRDTAFADAGIDDYLLPQAFDVDTTGTRAYVAAYARDFSEVALYEVGLGGAEPRVPRRFAAGFDSVERTLEVVGEVLWYGSSRRTQPGMWIFDLTRQPPQVLSGPLSTGLPPYSVVAFVP